MAAVNNEPPNNRNQARPPNDREQEAGFARMATNIDLTSRIDGKTLEEWEREIMSDVKTTAQQKVRKLRAMTREFAIRFPSLKVAIQGTTGQSRRNNMLVGLRANYQSTNKGEIVNHPKWARNEMYEIYLPDEDAINNTAAIRANMNAILGCRSMKQMNAYVAGILICQLPSMKTKILHDVESNGFNLMIINMPSQADEFAVDLANLVDYDPQCLLAVFAFCIIFMFKQVTPQNFDNVVTNRSAALRTTLGIPPDMPIPNIFNLARAQSLKITLGSIPELRRDILNMLIANMYGSLASHAMARYLTGILEWNEMNPFVFVYDALMLTQSPVMQEARISGEVFAYYEVCNRVFRTDHPQYFRYLCNYEDVGLLERNKYPVLSTVAIKVRKDLMGADTLQHFKPPKSLEDPLVKELYFLHKTHLSAIQPDVLAKLVAHMFRPPPSYEDEDPNERPEVLDDI